jgi:ssDNA-binding replication factor A large subunit
MDFETIVNKIKEKTNLKEEEINRKVIEKQQELSNLVSKEGAAYIIAKELGLDIFPKTKRRLEIKNILPKLKNLNLTARVVNVFETKQFRKKDKMGKVATVILGDATGTIRMSLWDAQTEIVDKLKPDMPVEIFGAYTKENGLVGTEIRLGNKGGIKILESSDIPPLKNLNEKELLRKSISNLKEGEMGEIRAAVVQLFETSVFYDICPKCESRVTKVDNKLKCNEHGEVEPKKTIVLSGVIDDGTGNIRAVFFRDVALKLIGMDIEEALKIKDSFFENIDILGKEFIMFGKIRRNPTFNRLEFVANNVREVDVEKEINEIINNLTTNA